LAFSPVGASPLEGYDAPENVRFVPQSKKFVPQALLRERRKLVDEVKPYRRLIIPTGATDTSPDAVRRIKS
jgi:hypothetical protein